MGKADEEARNSSRKRQMFIDMLRAGGRITHAVSKTARFYMIVQLGDVKHRLVKQHWDAIQPLTMRIGDNWFWRY